MDVIVIFKKEAESSGLYFWFNTWGLFCIKYFDYFDSLHPLYDKILHQKSNRHGL